MSKWKILQRDSCTVSYRQSSPILGCLIFLFPWQVCDYCLPPEANATAEQISDKQHPGSNAVDGDITTWWQSPPISRGLKYNRVTLSIDLQQTFQVAYIVVTMANSPRPGVWALERSLDGGQNWQPWQYFAGNDVECQRYFGMHANEKIGNSFLKVLMKWKRGRCIGFLSIF